MQATSWRWHAGAVGVLLLAAWLGVRGLSFDAIWYDEWRSLVYIGKDAIYAAPDIAGTIPRVIAQSDALNPPAYYLLLSVWATLTGAHIVTARYLSVLFGVLTVATVYRAGTDMASRQVGFTAALILGTTALFSVFMHELRTYALAALVITLHLWLYWRCTQPGTRRRGAIAFTLVTAVVLHTHYTAVLMVAGTFVHQLYTTLTTRRGWRLLGLYALAGLTLLPWGAVVLRSIALGNLQDRENTAMAASVLVQTLATYAGNGWWWLTAGALLLALGRARLLWVYALGGLAAYLLLNAVMPFACCLRYFVVMLPGLALLAGVGLARLRVWGVGVAVLWAALGIVTAWNLTYAHNVTNTPRWHYPWDVLHAAAADELQPDDTLLVLLPGGIAAWTHNGVAGYYFPADDVRVIRTFRGISQEQTLTDINAAVTDSGRVWLAYKSSWQPYYLTAIQSAVRERFPTCETAHDGGDLMLTRCTPPHP